MAAVDRKLDEPELLERMRLVGESFRPAAPIDRRSLFSGRAEQIGELFAVVSQAGQHAVVYGERGVGKTSLCTVAVELLRGANIVTAWATCEAADDFASVWRKALEEIRFLSTRQMVGFGDRVEQDGRAASQLLGDRVAPDDVRKALARISQDQEVAIFVDEFDRLRDPDARVLFADTIKALSDRVVRVTVVLIGVADNV